MRRSFSVAKILRHLSLSAVALAPLGACASSPAVVAPSSASSSPIPPAATTTSAALDQVPPPRDDGRLPETARPLRYALTLTVDPTQERFHGQATIDVELPRATAHVVLHGRSLDLTEITATAGSEALTGTATARTAHGATDPEEVVLTFPRAIPAGRASLAITYDAPFDKDLSGLYRVKDGERWYAFSQLESTYARRAFPCFDEPGFKTPFELHVIAPKGTIAVANTPETARSDAGDAGSRFDFAPTPPLSTYLVALAVGDFDVREGAKTPVPIRIITTKGKAGLGDFALDATAGLVKTLGDYFAIPYPFPKLDVVAVPDFAAGAMENPGLVTFREEALLLDAAHTSVASRHGIAVTIAHELAHMWFGDMVTMKWWNDVWLNEGFATWMETKATDLWHPDYAMHLAEAEATLRAMDLDALASARAVRQTVTTTSEIEEAFDEISYQKGGALLGMVERWIGPDVMQRGVRDYLRANAWKNAEASDLLGALDRASGRDVSGMAATFLDRPGVPAVAVASTCASGKVTLGLTQSAWHPLGVAAKETDATPWKIPVCVRAGSGTGAPKSECVELTGQTAPMTLDVGACPAWVEPNAGASGYYRASLAEPELRALAANVAKLDVPERISLASSLLDEVRAGELAPAAALGVLPAFDRETDSHVLGTVAGILGFFDRALVDARTRPAFRAYVTGRMARAKGRLGWTQASGEDADAALARGAVLATLGYYARDAATLREARSVAARWLKDPASVDGDVASIAVPLASLDAGLARFSELRAALRDAKSPLVRSIALSALGSFEDPAMLERAWDLALTDEIRQQDVFDLYGPALRQATTAKMLFNWLAAHWDAARAHSPEAYEALLVRPISAACDKAEIDGELAFYEPKVKEMQGAERPLAEGAEAATSCSAVRAKGAESVAAYFAGKLR